jgi:hypothetical protein
MAQWTFPFKEPAVRAAVVKYNKKMAKKQHKSLLDSIGLAPF